MALQEDFNQIIDYAHFWNWAPDWGEVQRIYEKFPDSFSVLTPFAYSYLECWHEVDFFGNSRKSK